MNGMKKFTLSWAYKGNLTKKFQQALWHINSLKKKTQKIICLLIPVFGLYYKWIIKDVGKDFF